MRTVPTWASVARGENPTLQEAPAATAAPTAAAAPFDAMALCRRYVVMGFRVHFSIKNNAGCEEICLFCRFPDPTAASSSLTRPPPSRRCQRRRNRGKPTTCTSSTKKGAAYIHVAATYTLPYVASNCHPRLVSISATTGEKNAKAGGANSNSSEKLKTTQLGHHLSPLHLPGVHCQRDHPLHDHFAYTASTTVVAADPQPLTPNCQPLTLTTNTNPPTTPTHPQPQPPTGNPSPDHIC